MFAISLLVLLVVAVLSTSAEQGKSSVIVCNSISCSWNKLCRCTRKNISIYYNTVTGLCLHHTDSMKDRVLEPMRKNKLLERYEYETYVADMLAEKEENAKDEELLKNPDAFARWMREHGMRKQVNGEIDS